jgi:hypothetical protein
MFLLLFYWSVCFASHYINHFHSPLKPFITFQVTIFKLWFWCYILFCDSFSCLQMLKRERKGSSYSMFWFIGPNIKVSILINFDFCLINYLDFYFYYWFCYSNYFIWSIIFFGVMTIKWTIHTDFEHHKLDIVCNELGKKWDLTVCFHSSYGSLGKISVNFLFLMV